MSLQNNSTQKQQYICFWEECDHRVNNVKELIIHLKEIHVKVLNIESPLFHCQWGDCKSNESTRENLLSHWSSEYTSKISKQVSTESQINQKSTLQNISESVQQQPDSQLELQLNQQNQQIEESQRVVCTQIQKLQLDTVPPDSSRQINTVEPKEVVIIDDDDFIVYTPAQAANTVSAMQQATNNRISVMRGFDIRPRPMAQAQHFSYLPATQGHSVPNQVQTSSQQFQVPNHMAQVPNQMAQVPSQMAQVSSQRTQVPSQRTQVPNQRTQVPNLRMQIPSQRVQMGANTSPYNNNLRYHSAQQGANMIRPPQQNSHSSGLPWMQTHQDGNAIRIIQQENDVLRMTTAALQESHSKLMRENEQLIIELQNLKAKIAAQEPQPSGNNESLEKIVTDGVGESNNNQEKMVESSGKSDSKECDISVITEAYVCQWNGCGKVFRTKLALKAHIPSEHIGAGSLRVRVDKL
ncbi:38005_t:CDS:2 [Gigaspora margarita]|uniref:38005_t:CDS:1 n=1 Tax=Gigaspora margarita TaxID=4874 RepID=A0ABN7V2R2_GIGMA|nr:38005_t:CDS:2 [Gigaspora margarita]